MTHQLYLQELIDLNPEINDMFKYTDYSDTLTNIYSDPYEKKLNKLNNTYLKRLNNKSQLTCVEKIIKHEMMASKCGWTPFDNYKVKGFPVGTIVNGNLVMSDGKLIEKSKGTPLEF